MYIFSALQWKQLNDSHSLGLWGHHEREGRRLLEVMFGERNTVLVIGSPMIDDIKLLSNTEKIGAASKDACYCILRSPTPKQNRDKN